MNLDIYGSNLKNCESNLKSNFREANTSNLCPLFNSYATALYISTSKFVSLSFPQDFSGRRLDSARNPYYNLTHNNFPLRRGIKGEELI